MVCRAIPSFGTFIITDEAWSTFRHLVTTQNVYPLLTIEVDNEFPFAERPEGFLVVRYGNIDHSRTFIGDGARYTPPEELSFSPSRLTLLLRLAKYLDRNINVFLDANNPCRLYLRFLVETIDCETEEQVLESLEHLMQVQEELLV